MYIKEQFKKNKELLLKRLNKKTIKSNKRTNYYFNNKQQFKEFLELIENKEDKEFFTNLHYIFEKTKNDKIIVSIVKLGKIYIKLFIKQQYLNKKDIEQYNKHCKRLVKLLQHKKENIQKLLNFNNNKFLENYNVINFIQNSDFKIINDKDKTLDKKLKKYEKTKDKTIKQFKELDKYENKLLQLLEKSNNI